MTCGHVNVWTWVVTLELPADNVETLRVKLGIANRLLPSTVNSKSPEALPPPENYRQPKPRTGKRGPCPERATANPMITRTSHRKIVWLVERRRAAALGAARPPCALAILQRVPIVNTINLWERDCVILFVLLPRQNKHATTRHCFDRSNVYM
jgi:hypothetical protein